MEGGRLLAPRVPRVPRLPLPHTYVATSASPNPSRTCAPPAAAATSARLTAASPQAEVGASAFGCGVIWAHRPGV